MNIRLSLYFSILFIYTFNFLVANPSFQEISKQVYSLYKQNKFKEAINLGKAALKNKQNTSHTDLSTLMINMGYAYKKNNEIEKAEDMLIQAKAIIQNNLSKNDPKIAIIWNNLGTLYKIKKDFKKSEEAYLHAITLKELNYGKNTSKLISTLNHLANVYKEKGNLEKNIETFKRAISISIENYGENNLKTGILYYNLAENILNFKKYEKAEKYFIKALNVFNTNLKSKQYKAFTLDALGFINKKNNKTKKAASCYKEALQIKIQILGKTDVEVGNTMNNLATVYIQQGLPEASELLNKALKICEKSLPKDAPEIKEILNNLIIFHQNNNDFKKAEKIKKRLKTIS